MNIVVLVLPEGNGGIERQTEAREIEAGVVEVCKE